MSKSVFRQSPQTAGFVSLGTGFTGLSHYN
jgi:hypothetical protein